MRIALPLLGFSALALAASTSTDIDSSRLTTFAKSREEIIPKPTGGLSATCEDRLGNKLKPTDPGFETCRKAVGETIDTERHRASRYEHPKGLPASNTMGFGVSTDH